MLQVGSNNTLEDRISFNLGDHRDTGLSIDDDDLTNLGNAQTAINALDNAIKLVNDERSNIGAKQNRLEFTSSNLMNSIQNNSASMSTIRDADFAVEAAALGLRTRSSPSQVQLCWLRLIACRRTFYP